MSCNKSVNKFGTIKVDKISVTEIDIPSTSPGNDVGTLKLSDNLKKKWHQIYFTVWIIGFMNMGSFSYYLIDPLAFPVKGGVLPIIMILWFYVWPYFFLNSMIVTISTTIPFCMLVLEQGSMTSDQIPYLYLIPFIFLSTVKWSKEKGDRIDFVKTKKLEVTSLQDIKI